MPTPDYSKFRSFFGIPGMSGDFSGVPYTDADKQKAATAKVRFPGSAFEAGQRARTAVGVLAGKAGAGWSALADPVAGFVAGAASTANAVNAATGGFSGGGQPDKMDRGYQSPVLTDPGVDVGNGISRRGNTFSNLGVEGLNSIDGKRSTMLPSAVSFLAGVPDFAGSAVLRPSTGFNVSPPSARVAAGGERPGADGQLAGDSALQGLVPGRAGGGYAGNPDIESLRSEAAPLLRSGGLVSNWRGRMLQKQSNRLAVEDIANANASANMLGAGAMALRASNELPIARMHDYSTQRGQDLGLVPHLPKFNVESQVNAALAKGGYATAHQLATIGAPRQGFPSKGFHLHVNPITGLAAGAMNLDTGTYLPYMTPDEQKKQQDAVKTR